MHPPSTKPLRIRPEQLAFFHEEAARRLVLDILEHVKEHVPESVSGLDEAEQVRRCEIGLRRALQFGLTAREFASLVIWVRLMFSVSPDFDLHPACSAILGDRHSPPVMRVESLLSSRNAIPWEEIPKANGEAAWRNRQP